MVEDLYKRSHFFRLDLLDGYVEQAVDDSKADIVVGDLQAHKETMLAILVVHLVTDHFEDLEQLRVLSAVLKLL